MSQWPLEVPTDSYEEEWDSELETMVVDLTRSTAGAWMDKEDLFCYERGTWTNIEDNGKVPLFFSGKVSEKDVNKD